MRYLLILTILAGCSGAALDFDTESDSYRAENPPDPFAASGPRLEL